MGFTRKLIPRVISPFRFVYAFIPTMNLKHIDKHVRVASPLIKRMGECVHGAVVNLIGSDSRVAAVTCLASCAASAGLAAAYAGKGVCVNAVNPGRTNTLRPPEGMQAEARQQDVTLEEAINRDTQSLPLKRFTNPEEIADAVVYLASARAGYVTGALPTMDGALTPMVV